MNVECAKCPLQPPTRRGKELELLGQTIAGECSLTGRERWIYLEDVEFILASGFSIGRYGYKLGKATVAVALRAQPTPMTAAVIGRVGTAVVPALQRAETGRARGRARE